VLNPQLNSFAIANPILNSFVLTPEPARLGHALKTFAFVPDLRERLIELGAKFVDVKTDAENLEHFLLIIGQVDNIHYWLEATPFNGAGCNWKIRASKLKLPDPIHPLSIMAGIADPTSSKDKPTTINHGYISRSEAEKRGLGCFDSLIEDCVRLVVEDQRLFDLHQLASRRVESRLLQLGYAVIWPEELGFDLECVSTAGGSRYYIDSLAEIASIEYGISFKDLRGERIVLSRSSGYEIRPLTFTSVAELAAEDRSLVCHQTELLEGFFYEKLSGDGRE
jgi:hypothetical protein